MMRRKFAIYGLALALPATLALPLQAQTLRGSPASVERIYRQALDHDLVFFKTGNAIREAVQQAALVPLEGNSNYALADVSFPYLVAPAHTFVVRLASQYRAVCGEKMTVTSATRPKSLRLANGVEKSAHPAGMAVDLRKPKGTGCLKWLRNTLLSLEGAGVLEAIEERNPPHFHVAVFPTQYARYVQARGGRIEGADGSMYASISSSSSTPERASVASARTYRVRQGDSLWTIARRNDVSVADLRTANELRDSRIRAGQILRIPAD